MDISGSDKEIGGKCKCGSVYSPLWVMICSESETKKAAKRQQRGKGERKKEERIICRHFRLRLGADYDTKNKCNADIGTEKSEIPAA